jgi:predicted deacylase
VLPHCFFTGTSVRSGPIKTTTPGVVVFLKTPGDRIDQGDVVAEIVNPLATRREKQIAKVRSGIDGILFSVNTDRYAKPGRILAKIAGKIPITGKGENLLTS